MKVAFYSKYKIDDLKKVVVIMGIQSLEIVQCLSVNFLQQRHVSSPVTHQIFHKPYQN